MTRGLLVGIIVGFALGWIVSIVVRDDDAPREDAAPLVRARPNDVDAAPAELGGLAPPVEPSPSAKPVDVAAIRRRLDAASEAGEWRERYAAFEALGRADTPEADRLLVQMLGDTGVRFEGPMGAPFFEWLEGSTVDGIPQAVRRRVAIDAETFGVDEATIVRDWVRLLMSHGTEADLDWVYELGGLDLQETGFGAMMASGHPAAVAFARRLVETRFETSPSRYRGGGHTRVAFRLLAEKDPGWARDRLAEEIDRLGTGEPLSVPGYDLVTLYAKTLAERELEVGCGRILGAFRFGLKRDLNCIRGAVEAARILAEAGHDVAPLREILAWPAEHVLEVAARGGPAHEGGHHWDVALRLLRRQRAALTEGEIAAVEAALPYTQKYDRLRLLRILERARRR